MYSILLKTGSFELRSYGVVIALAILTGYILARREAARRGMEPRLVEDFAFLAILSGILGARLYYVAFFDPGMFLRQPLMVLAVWKGGLAIHGALLAGLLTGIWFCRKHGISFWLFADTLAPALILGQAIGRLACFLNGDAYGIPTSVPWAVTFTDPNALAHWGCHFIPHSSTRWAWTWSFSGSYGPSDGDVCSPASSFSSTPEATPLSASSSKPFGQISFSLQAASPRLRP